MTQPTPTPVPDHGTGWGLLLLFIWLYAVVVPLGVYAVVATVLDRLGRRLPRFLSYLPVVLLLGALGVAGFAVLVAARAAEYDVVALLLGVVFVPLAIGVFSHRNDTRSRVAIAAHVAMAWSLPFLLGFGALAAIGTLGSALPLAIAGTLAASIAIGGTLAIDRLSVLSGPEPNGR